MKTLDQIAIKYGTDKATKHPTGAHGYTPQYDRVFSSIRDMSIAFLEIGVGGGESIQTWLEYFPHAMVFGVDLHADTNMWNDTTATADERYVFTKGDQNDPKFWEKFLAEVTDGLDVVVDDGGHFNDQIITTFCALWGNLSPGGLYCIEDLGVCFSPGSIFVKPGFPAHNDFFKTKVDEVLKDTHDISWMCLSKELAIIRKRE